MRAVDLCRRLPEDGSVERLCRVSVPAAGAPAELTFLVPEYRLGLELEIAMGAPDATGRLRHLGDGDAFLDALLVHHRGSRFWAEEVASDDAG